MAQICIAEGWFCIDDRSGNLIDPIDESEIRISSSKIRLLVFGVKNDPSQSRTDNVSVPIYEELQIYKRSPPGFLNYPSDLIKYWTALLKCKDICRLFLSAVTLMSP